jgi:hypothetical protein
VEGFPPGVSEILLLTTDFPYLDEVWIESLFGALSTGCDQVCVVEGERVVPLLGVYRREVLRNVERLQQAAPAPPHAPQHGRRRFVPAPAVSGAEATTATRVASPEAYRSALAYHGLCDGSHPAVTLELYGNLRLKTGCGRLPIRGDTVGTAFRVFRRVFPEAERLLPDGEGLSEHFRFSINGGDVTTDLAHPLREGDHLILFSATVGG